MSQNIFTYNIYMYMYIIYLIACRIPLKSAPDFIKYIAVGIYYDDDLI